LAARRGGVDQQQGGVRVEQLAEAGHGTVIKLVEREAFKRGESGIDREEGRRVFWPILPTKPAHFFLL
jgi:hypothetical protein